MMLGTRTAAWAKTGGVVPTARDYVQDGLIAMWDGIENAGWGQHDPSATVWKDLVGTKDLTVTLTGCEWGDDCLICSGTNGLKAYANGGLTNELAVEASIRINKLAFAYPYYNGYVFSGLGDNETRYTNSVSRCIILNTNGNYTHGQGAYAFKYSTGDHTLSAVFNGELLPASKAYDNSNEVFKDATTLLTAGGTGNITAIGSRGAGSAPFDGMVRSVRVYNRALTPAEIAANYAIDKARFNLP